MKQLQSIYISQSPEQTKKIAKNVYRLLKTTIIICLFGDLGSGKTTFTQGLIKHYGLPEKEVKSPTYVLCHEYKNDQKKIYQYDLYRLKNAHDLIGLGLEEIMAEKKHPVIIEWAENLGQYLPKKRIEVHFKISQDNEREITIKMLSH